MADERLAAPRVGVIMGSDCDWPVMADAAEALAEFDVPFEVGVVSAHRTPRRMLDYARGAAGRGHRGDHRRGGRRGAPARAWSPRPPRCR